MFQPLHTKNTMTDLKKEKCERRLWMTLKWKCRSNVVIKFFDVSLVTTEYIKRLSVFFFFYALTLARKIEKRLHKSRIIRISWQMGPVCLHSRTLICRRRGWKAMSRLEPLKEQPRGQTNAGMASSRRRENGANLRRWLKQASSVS